MSEIRTIGPACLLGEGPLWHPEVSRLFWFDIPKGELYSCNALGGQIRNWNFGEPASAAGWIDKKTLIVATASGLQKFDILSGQWTTLTEIEADNPVTRSNDGRIGPDGAFWIGTMARDVSPHQGAYYRYAANQLHRLIDNISIPNATCFTPDGRTAYLADTRKQVVWKWGLDENGTPVGNKEVHIDLRDDNLNPDGAVCDSQGYLWNAQWGASRVARYAPDGTLDRIIKLPASQITCPAFGGDDLKTLYVTSASEGLSPKQLEFEPDAGKIFAIDLDIAGIPEHRAIA